MEKCKIYNYAIHQTLSLYIFHMINVLSLSLSLSHFPSSFPFPLSHLYPHLLFLPFFLSFIHYFPLSPSSRLIFLLLSFLLSLSSPCSVFPPFSLFPSSSPSSSSPRLPSSPLPSNILSRGLHL